MVRRRAQTSVDTLMTTKPVEVYKMNLPSWPLMLTKEFAIINSSTVNFNSYLPRGKGGRMCKLAFQRRVAKPVLSLRSSTIGFRES